MDKEKSNKDNGEFLMPYLPDQSILTGLGAAPKLLPDETIDLIEPQATSTGSGKISR